MASQGPNSPSVAPSINWANGYDVFVSDDAYAFKTMYNFNPVTGIIPITGFGFSIPSGATIDGIVVSFERKANVYIAGIREAYDKTVYIIKGGSPTGTNKAVPAAKWGTSDTVVTYGGPTDLWGETWTDSDINSSDFGLEFAGQGTISGKGAVTLYIDFISITVYYTESGSGSQTVKPVLMMLETDD